MSDEPLKAAAHTYRSAHHPGDRSRAAVLGAAVVRPLASCMLPIMIITLVALLEGVFFLPYLFITSLAALGLASVWTHYRLRITPAAVQTREDRAAVLSVWEVLQDKSPANWQPVYDVREHSDGLTVTIGYSTYNFSTENWPEYENLAQAMETTRDARYPYVVSVEE